MVRSCAQWINEDERPTKYFCALENFLDKTIKKVHTGNNKIITDQELILTALQTYYVKLFKKRDAELKLMTYSKMRKGKKEKAQGLFLT